MGELYKDRQYLEQLAADELLTQSEYISGRDLILTSYFQMIAFDHLKSFVFLFDPILGESISEIINNGIRYLDNRTEFWRQQKPMYTRYVKKF